jgi:hypothetical protein
MLKVVPLTKPEEQLAVCYRCGLEYDKNQFAYAAYENDEIVGGAQFYIKNGVGYMSDLRLTDMENYALAMLLGRSVLNFLDLHEIKEVYFEIKNGFGEYGPIMLMGFKSPQGVEIPRLKILDKDGEVIEVLTGPLAIDELNRRALAYKASQNNYEALDMPINEEALAIQDYSGNPEDYS